MFDGMISEISFKNTKLKLKLALHDKHLHFSKPNCFGFVIFAL
jgi:hypothetical protein